MNIQHTPGRLRFPIFEGPFQTDEDVRLIGEGVLDRTLPKEAWTHAAHCAAAVYYLLEKPDWDLVGRMPEIIRAYNEATGVPDTDDSGYHDTITQVFLSVISQFLAAVGDDLKLCEKVNLFLASPFSRLEYLLLFYSRDHLFSSAARRARVAPDIRPLPIC